MRLAIMTFGLLTFFAACSESYISEKRSGLAPLKQEQQDTGLSPESNRNQLENAPSAGGALEPDGMEPTGSAR